jgi:tape measure domain-containing protein
MAKALRAGIQLNDGMTPVIRSMVNATRIAISSFKQMQTVSGHTIDTSAMRSAEAELQSIERNINSAEMEMRQLAAAEDQVNEKARQSESAFGGMKNKLMGMAATIGAAIGVKQIIGLADEISNTTARLNLMTGSLAETKQLQDQIYESAQRSRTGYLETADVVAKLGARAKDAFSTPEETLQFAENLNNQFVIAGASQQEIASASLQLTQGLGSGVLRGEELNAVFESAPNVIQTIADYLGKPIGAIRGMASEGMITADIVKNAMIGATDDINKQFESIPMTWSQLWTSIKNSVIKALEPVLGAISKVATYISDNWSTIAPIMVQIVAAIGAMAAAWGIYTLAQWLATGAAKAFFITLLSNPLTYIAIAIGLIVAAIVGWIQEVGGLKVAWLICCNAILSAWDFLKIGFFTGVYKVMNFLDLMDLKFRLVQLAIIGHISNLKAGVLEGLANMVNGAIGILNKFIDMLNKIPGVNIDAVSQVEFGAEAAAENDAKQKAIANEAATLQSNYDNKVATREAKINAMKAKAQSNKTERLSAIEQAKADAKAKQNAGGGGGATLPPDSPAGKETAKNTGSMADSMKSSKEDLKYLRDVATRKAVNRFTTASVNVNYTANNNVNSDVDVDGMNTNLFDKIVNGMNGLAAEG